MSIDITPQAAPSLSERVAEEIRVLLARRRIKQAHLARQLGVSEQWLSIRLRGVQPIDLNDLQRIAGALGVEAIQLIPNGQVDGQPTLQSFTLAGRTRPTGHPKRTRPRTSTRRRGRVAAAPAGHGAYIEESAPPADGHPQRTTPADNTRRTARVVAVARAYAGLADDSEARSDGAKVGE